MCSTKNQQEQRAVAGKTARCWFKFRYGLYVVQVWLLTNVIRIHANEKCTIDDTPDFDDVDIFGDLGGVVERLHKVVFTAALIAGQSVENLPQPAVNNGAPLKLQDRKMTDKSAAVKNIELLYSSLIIQSYKCKCPAVYVYQ